MANTGKSALQIVDEKRLAQITDKKALSQIVEVVLKENPENVKKYLAGNEKLFSFFVGEVMKKTQRKANPKVVNEILKEKLAKGEDKK